MTAPAQADLNWRSDVISRHTQTAPLFKGLSEDSLQTLLQHSFVRSFETGRTLFQQGDRADNLHLYFVLDGTVKTLRGNEDGEEAIMRLVAQGETFMEAVLFMDIDSPISAQVTQDARLLMIPARVIKQHAAQDNQFAYNLLQIVSEWYKTAMQQVDNITIKSPVQRVGYYLLNRFIEQGVDTSFRLKLPHQKSTIAGYLGMEPETFSRALKDVRKLGIDIDRDTLELKDAFALCIFCDPDTAARCPRYGEPGCIYADSY